MLVAPRKLMTQHSFRYANAQFWIGSEDGIVKFVSTGDPAFTTADGITVESTLDEVLALTSSEVREIPGIAHVVELPSGWTIAYGLNWDRSGPNGDDYAQYLYIE